MGKLDGRVAVVTGAGMGIDVSAMHQKIKNLPVEHFHDTTFVFSNGD